VVASFCASSWLDGNHDLNGRDLVMLARSVQPGPVLYAGFSAGGLAASLAAAADPDTVAYLGLDPVDSGSLGVQARPRFRTEGLFLLGEASPCNARSNFLSVTPEGGLVYRVRGATHGHFENPYDPAVERVCGRVEPPAASEAMLETIRVLATAWVLERAAGDETGAAVAARALALEGAWAERIERAAP
jgi:pimeloyl-ACP methyl ester carboxylesterase